ncbi:MAG: hypothetical protein RLZZ67_127 [Candidatus Parcubacteria bacterium]|jgi:glycosyltransferase involved in cell wall biosynthesis
MEKQKILILITKSNFGGAQRYVFDIARSLKDTHSVTVALGGDGLLKTKLDAVEVRTISIPFLQKNVNPFKDIAVFFWLWNVMRKEKPDVVHVNSSKIGGVGGLAARILRVPHIIFTAHAWAFNEDRGTISKWLITILHWTTVMLSHTTIAVSDAVRRQILHMPYMDKRIRVVHLGLEASDPMDKEEARKHLGIAHDTFSIGTIAELHPVKGLTYAIDAVRTLTFPFSYTIIGTGDLKQTLEKEIADKKLETKVHLTGFLPDASKYVKAFDIFLLPSLSEAFGYVLLEAGLASVPVVATSVGGIPEIIEDLKSGILIHSKNNKEIERALTSLHGNPENRMNLGKALNERVKNEFSLTKMVEKTVEVYKTK